MADKAAFVNSIYQAAISAGLSDPAARVMAAQAAIESSYGTNAPGNNYFGITKGSDWTGPTVTRNDHDASGKVVQRQFRSYDTPQAGIADRVALMASKFPGFNDAQTMQDALGALRTGKLGTYYEAPQKSYEAAVTGINKKFLAPSADTSATRAIDSAFPSAKGSSQDYLSALQYGNPSGGVGVNADKVNPEFANRMAALIQAAEKATGDKVSIFEGYRDPARSAQLRADYKGVPVKYDGKTYQPTPGMKGKYQAAAPMVSEHNLGMAADIRAGKNPDKYPSGPAYDYMVKHASEYGLQNLGANDPAHFEIPPNEYKLAMAGTPLKPFKNYNPDGLVPPMNIPTGQTAVGTKLDTQPTVVPMPGRPAALNAPPPRLPANAIVPRLQADNTLSYGQKSGITPAAKLAAAQSSHQDFGLGALSDPRTAALLAPTRMPPSLAAAGQVTAMPQSVGIHGAASLSAPTPVAPPIPMPGRPAALNSVPAPAPRPTVTVNPLPSAYTLNPTAMVDAAKKAGVISGPASWLPDQTIWNGAFGQQGMRDRIAAALPQGSSLDPKTNTVHVADPQALANSYLQKVPSLFRPMAQEAVAPAIHYAESAGFVQPQWPPSQTFPMPVPRPAMPVAPSAPATIQVLNPAYTAWQASQTPALKAGQAYTATGSIIPQSMADAMRAVSGSAYQQPIARQAAPPRFITQTVRAPVPMSRPLSFFAQPQVAAPRQVVAAPVQQQSAAQRVNAFSDKPFGSPFW